MMMLVGEYLSATFRWERANNLFICRESNPNRPDCSQSISLVLCYEAVSQYLRTEPKGLRTDVMERIWKEIAVALAGSE
jgi:hypothetical protein